MSRRHRLERVVDLLRITSANLTRVIELVESGGIIRRALDASAVSSQADVGLADVKEVRAKTSDEKFDKDLEDSSPDQRV